MTERPKILIVGTGLSAMDARNWNLEGWTVAVIHKAWELLPDRWDWFFHCKSFPEADKPKTIGLHVMNKEYCETVGNDQYCLNSGIRRTTMVFAAHYCLDQRPETLGFIGCDLNYMPDANGNNVTYGIGKPDAAELPIVERQAWNKGIEVRANDLDCELINFSQVESDLPFERQRWVKIKTS